MKENVYLVAYSIGVVAWLFGYMPGSLLVISAVGGAGVLAAIESSR